MFEVKQVVKALLIIIFIVLRLPFFLETLLQCCLLVSFQRNYHHKHLLRVCLGVLLKIAVLSEKVLIK